MRFWLLELPALLLTALWRLYAVVVAVLATVCVVTVLVQLGALILGLPIPFVGLPPRPLPAP